MKPEEFARISRRERLAWLQLEVHYWNHMLGHISDRMTEIDKRYGFYLGRVGARYVGASRGFDTRCGDLINRIWLLYAQARSHADNAQSMIEDAGLFRSGPIELAYELLATRPIRVESGEGKRLKVNVEMTRDYEGQGRQILHDLGEMIESCTNELEEFRGNVAASLHLIRDALHAHKEVKNLSETRIARGGPTSSNQTVTDFEKELDEVATTQKSDPIGAKHFAEDLLMRIRQVSLRWNSGIEALSIVDEVQHRLVDCDESIAALPEHPFTKQIANIRATIVTIRAHIQDDQDTTALELARQLELGCAALENDIFRLMKARSELGARFKEIEALQQSIQTLIPTAEEILAGIPDPNLLERAYPDEVRKMLEIVEAKVNEARGFQGKKDLLLAWNVLEDSEEFLTDARVLLEDIESLAARLDTIRVDAREISERVSVRLSNLKEVVNQSNQKADGVGRFMIKNISDFIAQTMREIDTARGQKPGWVEAVEALRDAESKVEHFENRVSELREAWKSSESAIQRNTKRVEKMIREIRREERDREHVDHLASVLEEKQKFVANLKEDTDLDAEELAAHVRELRRIYEETQAVWESEMSLVMSAEAAFERLRVQLNRIHHQVFSGVRYRRANLDFAYDHVALIRQYLAEKRYVEAIAECGKLEVLALEEERRHAANFSKHGLIQW